MLDELRYLLLIVDHGTFTEAAKRAHLSQPALTAAIRRLEDQLGARLLHRGPGGATLTAAGEALMPRARAALAAVEDGRRAVAEIAGLGRGEVRLGAGATACTYLLPPLLARYRRAHPGVRFLLREAFTDQLEAMLHDNELDLVVATAPTDAPIPEPFDPWMDDELIVVAAPGAQSLGPAREQIDRFSRSRRPDGEARRAARTLRTKPRRNDASGDASAARTSELFPSGPLGWITFASTSPIRAMLLDHVSADDIVMELGSIAAIKGNVRAGIGQALVSRASVRTDLSHGWMVELPTPWTPLIRRLILRHRGVDRLPPAAAALRELLLENAPKLAPIPTRKKGRARSRA